MIAALDLLNEVADRLGYTQIKTLEVATLSAEQRKLLRLLNRMLQTIGGYNDWPMLRKEGTLVLVDAIQGSADPDGDGSEADAQYVTTTENSTTVTIANITLSEAYVQRAFQVTGDEAIYVIEAVPSPTTLTLNRAWVGDSISVADERLFTIAMDRYVLPSDFGRMVDDAANFFSPYSIEPEFANNLKKRRRQRANRLQLGEPSIYTLMGIQNDQQVIVFDPFPETARMLTFDYQMRHPEINSDQDKILYPYDYLNAMIDAILELATRDYEDGAKSQQIMMDAVRKHNLQQANPGPTDSRPVFTPANDVRRSIAWAYGHGGGTDVDWGARFDDGSIYGF